MLQPVIQEWVQQLTFMQQSVLLTAIRGPDGVDKNHVSKKLVKWLRRCVLFSAFESKKMGKPIVIDTPHFQGGGGFTGPSCIPVCWQPEMDKIVSEYIEASDNMPHHFQMHILHSSEIIGYCHPDGTIRTWWNDTYKAIVKSMHLQPETREQMCKRLGDNEQDWLSGGEQ
jgi:hypothetical protein